MRSRHLVTCGLLLSLAAGTIACSDDGGDDDAATTTQPAPSTTAAATTTEPPDTGLVDVEDDATDAFCAAAQAILELDTASDDVFSRTLDPDASDEEAAALYAEAIETVANLSDEASTAYDDLAAASPPELAADIDVVQVATTDLLELLAAARTLDDLQTALERGLSPDRRDAVIEATLRIDEVTQAECGIAIAQ